MSYTYKGTKITGTSTTAKVFKKSGISDAKKNQTYLNKSTGHVYKCMTAGNASTAKWKYTETVVVAKPSLGVTKLSMARNRTSMDATWSVPKDLISKTKGDRATDLKITWTLGISGTPHRTDTDKKESDTTASINLNNTKIGRTTYTRASFYPCSKSILSYITANVVPHNKKGNGSKPASVTKYFEKPRAPVIDDFSFNGETGLISTTVTTDAGADLQERHDTRYKMTVTNTRTGETTTPYDNSSTSTSIGLSFNASDYQQLDYDQYIRVTVEAWSRGYAGDSGHVSKTFYISYPGQTTIHGVDVTSKDSSGKCTVRISTNNSTAHPVDQVRLEYLANVSYSKAESIPGGANWQATDIVDDKDCTALAMSVRELVSDPGEYTWVRVKSFHAAEAVLYRYSDYFRVTQLETPVPTAADDEIVILAADPGTDGESIILLLGWNADGEDDSTGTEITWDTSEDAWKSTQDPDDYTFTWSDGEITHGGVTYLDSATITIKGLEEGEKYYIKARRYLDEEDVPLSYSPYSNTATCLTSTTPESIVATCPRYLPKGSFLSLYWTFSGNGLQKKWQIVSTDGTIIANGEGGMGSTQISSDRIASFATNNSLTFTVQASTGTGFVVSEEHTVTIVEKPTLTISTAATMTAQPFTFNATASSSCDLIVIVSSQGVTGQRPTGLAQQTEGDTVHSEIYTPAWTTSGDNRTTSVELPEALDFWDGGKYTLTVTAIDRSTGLRSEDATANFAVAWVHQAPSPADTVSYALSTDTAVNDDDKNYYAYNPTTQTYEVVNPEGDENPVTEGWYEATVTSYVTLIPVDNTDDEGTHTQAVRISLTPPPGYAASDLYDIYRLTGDGARLIGEGFPLTHTATDLYAPFGDDLTLYYRIAVRTADGDVEFADFEYVADGDKLRFDWEGGSLELPYNLSIADKYKKDVDLRQHLDGSIDGYWNAGIERSGSFSSDLIYLAQQDEINAARSLARYAGAVFVRTPDGSAYEADVQITDLSTDGRMSAIAVDATEIGLTQEFILPTPYTLDEE